MSQKITRWSPDTCKCVINIIWDTDDPQVTSHEIVESCQFHNGVTGSEILLENQTKNMAIQTVAESSADFSILTDDGIIVPNLKKLSFSYDENRNLIITTKGSSSDLVKIKQDLDSKFGNGKIILNG